MALTNLSFNEVKVGDEFKTTSRTITGTDIAEYVHLSGDRTEHADKAPVVNGVLSLAVVTGMASETGLFRGSVVGFLEMHSRFIKTVKVNDTISAVVRVLSKRTTSKSDRGIVVMGIMVFNQHDELVLDGEWTMMVQR